MENNLQESIINALTYFDIFDYPLTLVELKKYCDTKISISDDEFLDILDSIYLVQESQGFYHLLGREKIVEKRLVRSELSIQKMAKAKIAVKILSKIPFIKLIGVSGSLSMNNSQDDDDIDLFFITQRNSLWIARLLVSMVLLGVGQKRKKKEKYGKNKICPNMFLSEDSMYFSKKSQNLYIAHEVLQLKVLFDKNNTHQKFLNKNKWIEGILPNGYHPTFVRSKKGSFVEKFTKALIPVNLVFYLMQKFYMSPHLTIERVNRKSAFFHPVDKGKIILDLFALKSKINIDRYFSNQWLGPDEAKFYFDDKKMRILN